MKGKTISSDITKSFTYTNTTLWRWVKPTPWTVNFNEFWPEL